MSLIPGKWNDLVLVFVPLESTYRRFDHFRQLSILRRTIMMPQNRSRRALALVGSLVVLVGLIRSPAAAQYAVTNLVSNQKGKARYQDTALVNAWGMSFSPGGPFWISDNGTGESTFYTGKGVKDGEIAVPP